MSVSIVVGAVIGAVLGPALFGVLLLIVGYFAPVPPRSGSQAAAS